MLLRTALLLAILAVPAAAQETPAPLRPAAWLVGCWEGMDGARVVEERWLPARGGTMVGAARTVRRDTTVSVELAVLRLRGDTLVYEAHPVGQEGASFPAVQTDSATLVFQNAAHDFPHRIVYGRAAGDSLHARVEGPLGGEWRTLHFRMARVRCEP